MTAPHQCPHGRRRSAFRSKLFRTACRAFGGRQLLTRPDTPDPTATSNASARPCSGNGLQPSPSQSPNETRGRPSAALARSSIGPCWRRRLRPRSPPGRFRRTTWWPHGDGKHRARRPSGSRAGRVRYACQHRKRLSQACHDHDGGIPLRPSVLTSLQLVRMQSRSGIDIARSRLQRMTFLEKANPL